MLDPRDLEALLAVADHGGISAAARELRCAQPALTRRLQRLERRLGEDLLERHAAGSRLLPAGRRLVARARPAIEALAALDAAPQFAPTAMRALAAPERGVRLGMLASVESWLLPRLPVGAASALTPVDLGGRDALQSVHDGHVDAALVSDWRSERVPEGMTVLDLLLEPYVMLCPAGHRLAGERVVSARSLRAEHVISAPHPDCGGRLAETGRSQRMAGSVAHAHALVAGKTGVALWPACTAAGPGSIPRAFSDRAAARRLGLAVGELGSPALREIVDAVAEAVSRRPGSRGQSLCHRTRAWQGARWPAASLRP